MGWLHTIRLQHLKKIQNEAACIVTGLTRSASLAKLYNEFGLTNLSALQKLHRGDYICIQMSISVAQ